MKDIFFRCATETVSLYNFCSSFEEGCDRCSLSEKRKKIILHKGNPKADILVLGEAPGKQEEEEGAPFVGSAGQLLNKIFESIELGTEDIFYTNCVFCRPISEEIGKQNYTPKEEQLDRCWPFVENLIRIIKPKIIIACGRTALSCIKKDPDVRLAEHEGKWTEYLETPVFVMTHPASLLYKKADPEEFKKLKIKVKGYMEYFKTSYKERMEKTWQERK
jgi:uracil-DNA glycosylase